MPDISDLTAASSVAGSDTLVIVQGGVTKKATATQVRGGAGGTLTLRVEDFGAVANSDLAGGGTDCASAFEQAIESLDSLSGGTIELAATPGSAYRLSRPVNVTRPCKIRGQGGALLFPATTICVDIGRSGFRIWGGGAPSGSGAIDTVFEDLCVVTPGKLATTGTASVTALSATVTVTAAGDFVNGQVVSFDGAGNRVTLQEVTAATTSGSNQVVLTSTGDQAIGLNPGEYVIIGTAYTAPTRVTAWDLGTLTATLASNAATTLSASAVKVCLPFYARIVSGGGTTTWTIDTVLLPFTMAGVVVSHGDVAFDACNVARFNRVTVGDNGQGFAGPAWLLRGSVADTPSSVTSLSSLWDCRTYTCKHALYVFGPDSNASLFNIHSVGSTHWSIVDVSWLGNTYLTCHLDGGRGFISDDVPGCAATLVSCYTEAGTVDSYGEGTVAIGGTMPTNAGGISYRPTGLMNRARIGQTAFDPYAVTFEPNTSLVSFKMATGDGSELVFGRDASMAKPGLFQLHHNGVTKAHPLCIADTGQTDHKAGTMWFASDFWFGEDTARTLTASDGARMASYRSGVYYNYAGAIVNDPAWGPYDSGTSVSGTPVWKKGDWVRDPNLMDGAPTRHVIEDGHRAREWEASTAFLYTERVCPTVDNHNGRIYEVSGALHGGTSAATEPDWTTAPNLTDTLTDGTVTWTNVGVAAYTQPVELDGFIGYTMVADAGETWAQTDRQFLCGTVKITKTLAAGRTITVPAGRWKRGIWNNTNQTLTFQTAAAGRTVAIATLKYAEIGCDGTDVYRRSADVTP
jgi:hypothetical protein